MIHESRSIPLLLLGCIVGMLVGRPALAGGIRGTVTYEGWIPRLRPIQMEADPECAGKHAERPPNEMLVLGEGGTMANVFVRVKQGLPETKDPAPEQAAILDHVGCLFSPHVLAMRTGQPLKILNSDDLLHTVRARPRRNAAFTEEMPAEVTEIEVVFDEEEFLFPIECAVHPWTRAWIAVMDHPYHAVTGEDGTYAIGDLPAGTYTIEAWHEELGTRALQVTLDGDGEETANFRFGPTRR